MRVIGVNTKRLTKAKAVLIVKNLTPQSLKDSTMQMYTSIEPRHGLGQGADLSILSAIKYTLTHAKSLHDVGLRVMSAADITRAMLSDFNSMKGGGPVCDATQVDSRYNDTPEQNPFGEGHNLRSVRNPIG